MLRISLSLVLGLLFCEGSWALSHAPLIEGPNLFNAEKIKISADSKKGIVVVFLSAVCPCSNSHLAEITSLQKDFPEFAFVAIHSNTDEDQKPTRAYFEQAKLPFPVIQDTHAKLADEFKASKTPHAFLLKPNGEIAYRGGVSSSRHAEANDQKFLREALTAVSKNEEVKITEGRTLGCAITRGDQYVW